MFVRQNSQYVSNSALFLKNLKFFGLEGNFLESRTEWKWKRENNAWQLIFDHPF